MRKTLHTAILILTVCLVQFFTVATLKVLNAGAPGGQAPASGGLDCVSGDVNNDDALNIADAIYVLTYLFNGGPEPVACAGNPTEVVVTGVADVNVVNTAAVEVTNTPDVNIANIPAVMVTNIPEVIVTNTADINVVSIPPVVISSMPLVSDDFVDALGQFFPKAGDFYRQYFDYSTADPEYELVLVPSVPVGKVLRITKALDNSGYTQSQYFREYYVNGAFIGVEFASADYPFELLSGDVLTVRRSTANTPHTTPRIEIVGYFLDYTPQP